MSKEVVLTSKFKNLDQFEEFMAVLQSLLSSCPDSKVNKLLVCNFVSSLEEAYEYHVGLELLKTEHPDIEQKLTK